ncbi:hypothetical protein BRARA_F01996 [Brassica rapa]|uniref:GRF-type domain-containing protein n=1 Tax=Brassica campestris TaxID=3711 RepID=A0A397YZ58_BRACM|nr:hypothetical protein BRARA_F01996 [Brassica rapa]
MNTSRRHSYGVPSRCWCGKGVVIFYSRTDDNPYRRFYRCEIGAQRKKENHLFKWVDEALLDEIRRVEAEQGRIVEEIHDLKSSMTQTIEEEVKKQENSLELENNHPRIIQSITIKMKTKLIVFRSKNHTRQGNTALSNTTTCILEHTNL